jgi:predicted N-acetyltransferase YhbS
VHLEAESCAVQRGVKEHFEPYGNQQVHLLLLATHPDHQHKGAASLLCNWGLEVAMKRQWPLTLVSSESGKPLYEYLGYDCVGKIHIQAKGEDDFLFAYCFEKHTAPHQQTIQTSSIAH